jgi:hypothetical protein
LLFFCLHFQSHEEFSTPPPPEKKEEKKIERRVMRRITHFQ